MIASMPNTPTKAKLGRPPEPVPADVAADVLHWLAQGKTLRSYCRQPGKPSYRTIYDWLDKDEELSSRFARARDLGEEIIAQECLDISDDDSKDVSGELQMPNNVAVNRAKLRIETRLKLLAIWNPKKYGAKSQTEVTGADGGPLQVVVKSILEDK
jgi:hypothetical protein